MKQDKKLLNEMKELDAVIKKRLHLVKKKYQANSKGQVIPREARRTEFNF